jgi:hypothetical protein
MAAERAGQEFLRKFSDQAWRRSSRDFMEIYAEVSLEYGDRQQDFRSRLRDSGITISIVTNPHELQAGLVRALLDRNQPDREAADSQANKWGYIHAAMCRRIAAVMVDAVRLLMIRSSRRAHRSNSARYDEFLIIARDHFEDLRRSISALPAIGDSRQYKKSGEIELLIQWLLRTFALDPGVARASPREIEIVREAMSLTLEYFNLYPGPAKDAFEATTALALRNYAEHPSIDADADAVFMTRQSLQTMAIAMHERDVGPGILMTRRRRGPTAPRWNWSRPRPSGATSSAAWPHGTLVSPPAPFPGRAPRRSLPPRPAPPPSPRPAGTRR